jgi:HAE1 family hydrophobic/amphiphilic exporter-1
MRSMIRWAIGNPQAMNTLVFVVMAMGVFSFANMRRESFPEFDLEILLVSVPYPGASPEEVEEGICQKIEEAVHSIAGIKKKTSVSREGIGYLVLELEPSVKDVQRVLSEVRAEVDRIPSFPELAEQRDVRQITMRLPAIRVAVVGPTDAEGPGVKPLTAEQRLAADLKLRDITERVREELLTIKPLPPTGITRLLRAMTFDPKKSIVSQANILGARPYQIDVEVREETLRRYGLTLKRVAQILRSENVDIPGGTLKSNVREVLLRANNKRVIGEEIAELPLLTRPDGVVLTVGDIGIVRDGFSDMDSIDYVDGRPALVIAIDRTSNEDVLALCDSVYQYAQDKQQGRGIDPLPPGYEVKVFFDQSVHVRGRMELLQRNGTQGLILVFLVLAIFLELRLAFWVALGIPISVLGAGCVLFYMGHTLNLLSMFAFLLALGIVVDDAIVIGENIYTHRGLEGVDYSRAAVDGAYEVLPAVTASVTTTVIAFAPLFFISGVMGKFFAVLPVAVIAMLVISLAESVFVLPCHLAHRKSALFGLFGIVLYPLRFLKIFFDRINIWTHGGMRFVVERIYLPAMRWGLDRPWMVVMSGSSLLVITMMMIQAGVTPFVIFPKVDSPLVGAKVVYPAGTPAELTDEATRRLEAAVLRAEKKLSPNRPLLELRHRAVGHTTIPDSMGADQRSSGSHVGVVDVELVDLVDRTITSEQLIAAWRAEAGFFPGAETLSFGAPAMGPGGRPIEFKLLVPRGHLAELEQARDFCKAELAKESGVFDIGDDMYQGKLEYHFSIKDQALAMGITARELADTIRGSYYGEEVMRLQRGRHEVKLMVRYPEAQRRSLSDLTRVRVRAGDGIERPLTELADITEAARYGEINRVDQMRSVTITADMDEAIGNAAASVARFQRNVIPIMQQRFPHVMVRWEGQQEQTVESVRSLLIGFLIALVAIFVVLTVEFRSYFQPLLILAIIPFGLIGAVWGHALMGLNISLMSMCGIVALTGVVINDSIVLVDFINRRVRAGVPLKQALLDSGRHRFRPVVLTSMTTLAGLFPLLLEPSFQAQLLKPMATAITFGLMLGTVLILFLVPTFYMIYGNWLGVSMTEPPSTGDVPDSAGITGPTSE